MISEQRLKQIARVTALTMRAYLAETSTRTRRSEGDTPADTTQEPATATVQDRRGQDRPSFSIDSTNDNNRIYES